MENRARRRERSVWPTTCDGRRSTPARLVIVRPGLAGVDCHRSRGEEEKATKVVSEAAARRRRAAYLPWYLPEITLVLLDALGAGEPDLEELLDALEELHVVGAVVLGVRHPLAVGCGRLRRNCKCGTRGRAIHVSRLRPSSIFVA